jgi:hypothetical protein
MDPLELATPIIAPSGTDLGALAAANLTPVLGR